MQNDFISVMTAIGNEIILRVRDIKCIKTEQANESIQWKMYLDSSFADISHYHTLENPLDITKESFGEIAKKLLLTSQR